jgi:hypothetical protein
MKKIIHNIKTGEIQEVDMTADEVSQAETDAQNALAEQQSIETAKQADAINKANGNQKLLDLGLSQAEATALTGYTPPVSE